MSPSKIDLSPAADFKSHKTEHIGDEPVMFLGLAGDVGEVSQPVPRIDTFLGGDREPSNDEAVDKFNDMFRAWIKGLPATAELFWRREPVTVQQHSFERDRMEWRVACRVSAYGLPSQEPVPQPAPPAPTDTELAEAEAKRVAAAEAAALEELRLMASAGEPLVSGGPVMTQEAVDSVLGVEVVAPGTAKDIGLAADVGDAPNEAQTAAVASE